MKKLFAGIALAISVTSFAQTIDTPPMPIEDQRMDGYLQNRQPAVLRVKVINSDKPLTNVPVKYTLVHLGPDFQQSYTTGLANNGELDIVLSENLSYQQVWLRVENYLNTGLVVNTDLDVIIDAALIKEEISFTGKGLTLVGKDADLNQHLLQNILYKRTERSALLNRFIDICMTAGSNKLNMQEFVTKTDSFYAAMKKRDDEFLQQMPGFEWAINNERETAFYEWLIRAYWNKEMPDSLVRKIVGFKPYFNSNGGVSFYRSLSADLVSKNYKKMESLKKDLLANTNALSAEKKILLDSIAYFESVPASDIKMENLRRLNKKRQQIFQPELEELELKLSLEALEEHSSEPRRSILKMALMERWKDKYESRYPTLIHSVETNWVKRFIESRLQEAISGQQEVEALFKTAKALDKADHYIGKPVAELPFGARLYRLDSIANAGELVANLRLRFKGKALLLDIWATWCVPCIQDIPFSKKLHEENSDLPIEYIYLCSNSNSNEETWKQRVVKLKAPGIHIFVDDGIVDALRQKLNASSGFPAYVVIDQQGRSNAKAISFMGIMDRDKLKQATGIK